MDETLADEPAALPRPYLPLYLLLALGSAGLALALFTRGCPVDVVVLGRPSGLVRVVFDVQEGLAPIVRDGRRVYEIPPSGTLFSQFPNANLPNRGNRFFMAEAPMVQERQVLRAVAGRLVGAGSAYIHDPTKSTIPETSMPNLYCHEALVATGECCRADFIVFFAGDRAESGEPPDWRSDTMWQERLDCRDGRVWNGTLSRR
jgi:hypothetical protein